MSDRPDTSTGMQDISAPLWLFEHVAACIRKGHATDELAANVDCLRAGMVQMSKERDALQARAEAAEAQLRDLLSDPRVKALVSEVGKLLVKMEATGFPTRQLYGLRNALADAQKE